MSITLLKLYCQCPFGNLDVLRNRSDQHCWLRENHCICFNFRLLHKSEVSESIVCWKLGTGITGILDGRSTYLRCNILSGSPTFMILRRYTKVSGLHCKSMFWRRTDKRFAGESLNFVTANNWMSNGFPARVQCKDARLLRGRPFYDHFKFWSTGLTQQKMTTSVMRGD